MALSLIASSAFALGPHETALLVNAESESSVKIAAEYASLRSVPQSNIISIKGLGSEPGIFISRDDFLNKIWIPVNEAITSRKLDNQVFAWIYAPGFPVTIKTEPNVSITGFTFVRTKLPENEEDITKALYASPLFADTFSPSARGHRPRTFDRLKSITGRDMPLPAFMLGYTGEHGNSAEEVSACLKKAVSADYTAPRGTVYFLTSDDIRAKTREWQFAPTVRELEDLKIRSSISAAAPVNAGDILGIIMGSPEVKPISLGTFLPGAFADHLTSFAAVFNSSDQTKCTEWIKAGASGTAGTVTEPLSAWPKFPHARIFVHYASGCTLIESFYQSVRTPLQILPLGDPLCQPWAPRAALNIEGIPENPANDPFTCKGSASYKNPLLYAELQWLLDGLPAGSGDTITVNTTSLAKGGHEIRLIALIHGPVRSQNFLIRNFSVK